MKTLPVAILVTLLPLLVWAEPASARVERFAVLIGNDVGEPHDTPLKYATSDAARLHAVLDEVGGFAPFNMVLLRNEDSATVRSTLLSINERVRAAVAQPDTEALLMVYYSGHADAQNLHLGTTPFPMRELAQMVRGSAATFRLVVVDACRSGALTRVKGGRIVDPFAVPGAQLPGEGLAFLTSASASEDAQESDALQGSFFTHALISGLLGAADGDGNGEVALEEAFRYAYDSTRRATSRTEAGVQHPTFRYDFRGTGALVLTRPGAYSSRRGRLLFPPDLAFMLMREHAEGTVVAEVTREAAHRELSVAPGRYFVRARGDDVLFEGEVRARAGASLQVDTAAMERIEFARLVRKGGHGSHVTHGLEAGLRLRSPLPNEGEVCTGATVGYVVDFAEFGLRARASACAGGYTNERVDADVIVADLEARIFRSWDVGSVALDLGLGTGAALHSQRFETAGRAPSRQSLAPFLSVAAGAGLDLGGGFALALDVAGETHFIRTLERRDGAVETRVAFAIRPTLGLLKRF